MRTALNSLDAGTADDVLAVAETASTVRGYENVKLGNVERFRAEAAAWLAALPGRGRRVAAP